MSILRKPIGLAILTMALLLLAGCLGETAAPPAMAGCGAPQEPESWRASLDGYCHQASLSWTQREYAALAKDGATFRGSDWAEAIGISDSTTSQMAWP